MRLGAKLVLFVLMTIFAMSANAQIAVTPPVSDQAVCVDKSDAYKLALADMQNTLAKLWSEFVAEGRCRFMPAQYLFTIDTYTDVDHKPSRVVELLAFGKRVWGIRDMHPAPGVWRI